MLCGVCPHLAFRTLPDSSFFGSVKVFGVAFREFAPGWNHAAIVFTDIGSTDLRLLHLGGNYDFRNDLLEPEYLLVPCDDFSSDELDLLAELAQRMWKQTGTKIPYNFDYDGSESFDIDLAFMADGGRGLTCATFVLAFFHLYGLAIVDVGTWKFRPEDLKWQKRIFEIFEKELSVEHAARMKANIGSAARFRPEEVIGSVSRFAGVPLHFERARVVGKEFLHEVHGL
ncbi:hypothetical protein [Pseudomonas mandelii]|uniref:hypothetical protein n=1 Tax=Pseudomonas mandelii TaxID=75612 RepID=UPI00224ADB79|nr:hypothetical protein [Pseudomonas mandelii]MCX2896825.1 hypothetical protein [Pseudomonas mandelii]